MNKSILDHEIISSRYFFPRKESFADPFWVNIKSGDGDIQLGCYYMQKFPQAKTVVFFHGNGEVVADYIDFFVPLFQQLEVNCFLAEYRGYGLSTGLPAMAAMLGDVEKIIESIALPHEQLVLFGRSVGAMYAIHGASLFPGIGGLILESGAADILERILLRVHPGELNVTMEELEEDVKQHFHTQAKLQKYQGPLLVMHAQHDTLVHCAHGKKLYEWSPQPEGVKKLKIFEQGDHNNIFSANAQEYVQLLADFLVN